VRLSDYPSVVVLEEKYDEILKDKDFLEGSRYWRHWETGFSISSFKSRKNKTDESNEYGNWMRVSHDTDKRSGGAWQRLDLPIPKYFRVGVWSKAENVEGPMDSTYSLIIEMKFKDSPGSIGTHVLFQNGTTDWEYKSVHLKPPIDRVRKFSQLSSDYVEDVFVRLNFSNRKGTVWFRNLTIDYEPNYSKMALFGQRRVHPFCEF